MTSEKNVFSWSENVLDVPSLLNSNFIVNWMDDDFKNKFIYMKDLSCKIFASVSYNLTNFEL